MYRSSRGIVVPNVGGNPICFDASDMQLHSYSSYGELLSLFLFFAAPSLYSLGQLVPHVGFRPRRPSLVQAGGSQTW